MVTIILFKGAVILPKGAMEVTTPLRCFEHLRETAFLHVEAQTDQ
jgi:hypothetical protein